MAEKKELRDIDNISAADLTRDEFAVKYGIACGISEKHTSRKSGWMRIVCQCGWRYDAYPLVTTGAWREHVANVEKLRQAYTARKLADAAREMYQQPIPSLQLDAVPSTAPEKSKPEKSEPEVTWREKVLELRAAWDTFKEAADNYRTARDRWHATRGAIDERDSYAWQFELARGEIGNLISSLVALTDTGAEG